MNGIVSIVIPVYNIEKFIARCIESILNQTYKAIEVLLVDDGSTDNSGTICDSYATSNNKVRVIHQENGGLSAARNRGIDEAKGEFVFFVDGDDIIDARTIETLLQDFDKRNDIVYSACSHQRINASYVMKSFALSEPHVFSSDDILYNMLAGKYDNISAWGKLYRKSRIGSVRFPVGKIYFEDKSFLVDLLLNHPHLKVLERKDPMYGYLVRENSITTSKFNQHSMDVLFNSQHILNSLKSRNRTELIKLGERNDIVSHLMVLKSIVRSRRYKEKKDVFNKVKTALFSKYKKINYELVDRYWVEIVCLRVGNSVYILCVRLFDLIHH